MTQQAIFGISAALATPYSGDNKIDYDCLVAHSLNLLKTSCNSVTCFGTTAEAPSLSFKERHETTKALISSGIRGEQIVMGIILSALGDAIAEAQRGMEFGCKALLVAPPYYFKDTSDDGLYAWYASFILALGKDCPKIILYHIPQVTEAPLSISLITRLKKDFPDQVFGVKDSSGSWENSQQLLALDGLAILIGDERLLAQAARMGAAGSISGVANFQASALHNVLASGETNTRIDTLVNELVTMPVIPALKVALSAFSKNKIWQQVRSPLQSLSEKKTNAIFSLTNDLFAKDTL